MHDTEFAHWCYRVKSLEREIPDTKRCVAECRALANNLRPHETIEQMCHPEHNRWDDETDALQAQLTFEIWLLEEARYMVWLGMLGRKLSRRRNQ